MFDNPLIREVTLKDFTSAKDNVKIHGIKNGIVFVGAEWCGYCKKVKPEIEKLAIITGLRLPVVFVDGANPSNKQLLNLLKVSGFPTIFMVNNNKLSFYNGERTANSILSSLCSMSKKLCFIN